MKKEIKKTILWLIWKAGLFLLCLGLSWALFHGARFQSDQTPTRYDVAILALEFLFLEGIIEVMYWGIPNFLQRTIRRIGAWFKAETGPGHSPSTNETGSPEDRSSGEIRVVDLNIDHYQRLYELAPGERCHYGGVHRQLEDPEEAAFLADYYAIFPSEQP